MTLIIRCMYIAWPISALYVVGSAVFDDENAKYALHPFWSIHSAQTFPSQLDAVYAVCYAMSCMQWWRHLRAVSSVPCPLSVQFSFYSLPLAFSVLCFCHTFMHWWSQWVAVWSAVRPVYSVQLYSVQTLPCWVALYSLLLAVCIQCLLCSV